jgi:hypothetical protein
MSDGYDIDTSDPGHEVYEGAQDDYATGHETFLHDHGHQENFAQYAEQHLHEHQENFEHGHHEEYNDPRGTHYESDDYTKASESDLDASAESGLQYNEADHDTTFADASYAQEHFAGFLAEHDVPGVEALEGHGEHPTQVSN